MGFKPDGNGFSVGEAVFIFFREVFVFFLFMHRDGTKKTTIESNSFGPPRSSDPGSAEGLGRRLSSLGSRLGPAIPQLLNLSGPQFPHL